MGQRGVNCSLCSLNVLAASRGTYYFTLAFCDDARESCSQVGVSPSMRVDQSCISGEDSDTWKGASQAETFGLNVS